MSEKLEKIQDIAKLPGVIYFSVQHRTRFGTLYYLYVNLKRLESIQKVAEQIEKDLGLEFDGLSAEDDYLILIFKEEEQ